ncbi:hypothetical protein KIPB_002552, partial [Kipferlia bialata]|eukprot:g2552.t1
MDKEREREAGGKGSGVPIVPTARPSSFVSSTGKRERERERVRMPVVQPVPAHKSSRAPLAPVNPKQQSKAQQQASRNASVFFQ